MSNQTTPLTATTALQSMQNTRVKIAIHWLLKELKQFVRAYPKDGNAEMPDYNIEWVAEYDRDPKQTIYDSLKAHPELWATTLPDDVCIVPRSALEKVGLTREMIDYLAGMGAARIETHAGRHRLEMDERDR